MSDTVPISSKSTGDIGALYAIRIWVADGKFKLWHIPDLTPAMVGKILRTVATQVDPYMPEERDPDSPHGRPIFK